MLATKASELVVSRGTTTHVKIISIRTRACQQPGICCTARGARRILLAHVLCVMPRQTRIERVREAQLGLTLDDRECNLDNQEILIQIRDTI